jgi:hypothetical protein
MGHTADTSGPETDSALCTRRSDRVNGGGKKLKAQRGIPLCLFLF